jgi:malonate transporter and related proteins
VLGVLTGFAIIGIVIAAGYLVARFHVVPAGANVALNRVAFFVASPALLFTVLARADLHVVFSRFLLVAAISAAVVAVLFVVVSRIWFRMPVAETTLGAALGGYVNANNIGLPVATYVIGDPQYVAPILLLQLIVFAPIVLGILDVATRGRASVVTIVTQPLRNPIILGSLLGLVVALTGWTVPPVILEPLKVLGGAAVPLVLLAFGMSLRGQRPLAPGSGRRAILVATALKAVVMPAVAFALGAWVFHLPQPVLAASTIIAALPSAQNMTNYAVRYDRGTVLARDTVLLTTIAAVPVIFVIAALLPPG